MTTEEYLLKRVQELEKQVEDLKWLIGSREVHFVFETKDMPKYAYKVEFENGNIKVTKENENE